MTTLACVFALACLVFFTCSFFFFSPMGVCCFFFCVSERLTPFSFLFFLSLFFVTFPIFVISLPLHLTLTRARRKRETEEGSTEP